MSRIVMEIVCSAESEAPAGLRHTFADMVRELWHCRELLWQLTLRDLRVRYKQALLGAGWALLLPGLVILAGLVIRQAMAQLAGAALEPRGLAILAVKALPWGLFAGAVGFATTSLTNNLHLVTRIFFPREVFPLACLLTQLVDSSVASVVVVGTLVTLGAAGLSPALAWVPLLVAALVALTAGACLTVSCANLFFRDIKHLVQVLLPFGMLLTPIFFDAEQLGATGCRWLMLNPLAPLVEGLRLTIFEGHNLLHVCHASAADGARILRWHPLYLGLSLVWAGPGSVAAWLMFHRLEPVFAERI